MNHHVDQHHRHDHGSAASPGHDDTPHKAGQPFTDPVCGMQVAADPNRAIDYAGQEYYFCSTRCMDKFRSEPQRISDRRIRNRRNRLPQERFIPARCIRKSASRHPAIARSAAWRWSR